MTIPETINPSFMIVACMFIACDIITGVTAALINKEFESPKMRSGGLKKFFYLIIIAFGVCLDLAQNMVDLGFSLPCTSGICAYLTLMEIMSCIENIEHGFPGMLPKALTKTLKQTAKNVGVPVKDDDEEG